MRIRHYLRGLGIGIIVSTLLVGFAYRNNAPSMTDDEVINRAKELGMVEENRLLINSDSSSKEDIVDKTSETNIDNSSAKEVEKTSETNQDSTSDDKKDDSLDEKKGAGEEQKADSQEVMISVESTPLPTEIVVPNIEDTFPELEVTSKDLTSQDKASSDLQTKDKKTDAAAKENSDKKTDADTQSKHKENYTISIAKGSGSDTVSRLLEKGGVIGSATDFDKYLCGNGYDSRIVEGNHAIPAGATYKEIADIITTRN